MLSRLNQLTLANHLVGFVPRLLPVVLLSDELASGINHLDEVFIFIVDDSRLTGLTSSVELMDISNAIHTPFRPWLPVPISGDQALGEERTIMVVTSSLHFNDEGVVASLKRGNLYKAFGNVALETRSLFKNTKKHVVLKVLAKKVLLA